MENHKISKFFERADKKLGNFQFLSGNLIKIIAICLMLFDHFNKTVLSWWTTRLYHKVDIGEISVQIAIKFDEFIRFTLYPIGHIAFPLFCFLISEGFFYTRNRKKYFLLYY